MDFQALRNARGLTLKQAAKLSGYTIGAINGEELKGNGSARLKEKLLEIYGVEKPGGMLLHDAPPPPDQKQVIAKLRRQVESLESHIHGLKQTLAELE